MLKNKIIRGCVGIIFGISLLFLSLKNIQWVEVKGVISNAKLAWIGLAIIFYWLELWLRIYRWSALLSHVKPHVNEKLLGITLMAGYAANNILPAKLGEIFRADLLGRLSKISRLTVLGSIVLERLLDMIVIFGMATWGILTVTKSHMDLVNKISHILFVIGIVLLVMIISIYLIVRKEKNFIVGLLHRVSDKFKHLISGLHIFGNPSSYFKLIVSSGGVWFLNSCATWFILMALGVNLSIQHVLLLMGIVGISAAIPAAPAGIGTLQYAFYTAFILIGLSPSIGIAASIIVQLALLGSATIVGAGMYYYALTTYLTMPNSK